MQKKQPGISHNSISFASFDS